MKLLCPTFLIWLRSNDHVKLAVKLFTTRDTGNLVSFWCLVSVNRLSNNWTLVYIMGKDSNLEAMEVSSYELCAMANEIFFSHDLNFPFTWKHLLWWLKLFSIFVPCDSWCRVCCHVTFQGAIGFDDNADIFGRRTWSPFWWNWGRNYTTTDTVKTWKDIFLFVRHARQFSHVCSLIRG